MLGEIVRFGLTKNQESSCGTVQKFPHLLTSQYNTEYSISVRNKTQMKYQDFINDRTNPYGSPARKQNNLNEKEVYKRIKSKGGSGDKICFSQDNKQCTVIDTIYQSQIRSENEAGTERFMKKFERKNGLALDGEERRTLYEKTIS